jgi:predicted RNA polymerase sigma factor
MTRDVERAALTLRLVGGLTTAEIARGFLTTESTMGQRISRAKKTLSEARAEFELPTGQERHRPPQRRHGRDLPDLQRGLHRHRRR